MRQPSPETAPKPRAHVVIGGGTGLIGRALTASLRADGIGVTHLVRRAAAAPDEVEWLTGGRLDPAVLEGATAAVNLGGATIGRFPWTAAYRQRLRWSRLTATLTLADAVRELGTDAPALVSASAVGFYGSAPGVRLTEASGPGDTFLASLCAEWERAALTAGPHSRVSLLRTAPVVHAEGVLKPLTTLTRLGVSGPLGRGTQMWPWISLEDEVRAIRHTIDAGLTGPVNLAGPTPANANDLGFALAVRMNRPYLLRAPLWAVGAVLGRDATEGLLACDAEVVPQALTDSGFTFRHRTVEEAVAAAVPAAD